MAEASSDIATKKTYKDVSIVMCAHKEGRLLHYTLKSIIRSINYAKSFGLYAELIIVADLIDEETRNYLKNQRTLLKDIDYKIENVSYGSTGMSRNHGIKMARAKYVGVIDGDDLMCENWLVEAVKKLQKSKYPLVVHPQYVLGFGAKDFLWQIHSSESKYFSHRASVEHNYFCTLMLTTTKLAKATPFKDVRTGESFGYEDWLWNCDTLQAGVVHDSVPKTMCAYRNKNKGSKFVLEENCLLPRTEYLLDLGAQDNIVVKRQELLEKRNIKNSSLEKSRSVIDQAFNKLFKPIGKKIHPRLELYFTSMQYETLHLFRPIKEPVRNLIPDWLTQETNQLHKIEPRIFLSEHLRETIYLYSPMPTAFTDAYWDILSKAGTDSDFLFIVPYLKNGGAEKLISNFIWAILANNPRSKITILATEDLPSPNSDLNEKINFIQPGSAFFELNVNERARLIAVLIAQTQPSKVHLINSVVGYMALERYARALSKHSKLFITIFSIDKTDEGRDTHVFIDRAQDAIEYIDRIFTDNQAIVDRLVDMTAIDKEKFAVVFQPVNEKDLPKSTNDPSTKFRSKPAKVLWAGRIDREKRPDVLIKIAELSHKRQIEAEYYTAGSPAFENSTYIEAIIKCPLIKYIGEFQGGLTSLPLKKFDIFLLTSEWEGLPNVILEAIAGGLLIVAPDIGGIHEVIKDVSYGYLIEGFSNIDGYVDAIDKSTKDNEGSRQMILKAQQEILKRHTPKHFLKSLNDVKSYLE